jgi:hypothetical protein
MTNQEILTKAIEKAVAGGWDFFHQLHRSDDYIWFDSPLTNKWDIRLTDGSQRSCNIDRVPGGINIIFNHDFAKALWGDSVYGLVPDDPAQPDLKEWQWQLQRMVIADDPIQYLGSNLNLPLSNEVRRTDI